ncbi:MAG: hypothetical protein MI807_06370 [Verrucomicrobiales bacterium]|nr:hypothetical protein [Verrucomicrobiales bacterium]
MSTEPGDITTREITGPLHLGYALLISLFLLVIAYIAAESLGWSNTWHGISNGVRHSILVIPIWIVFFLPWGLGVFAIYRATKWNRFRTAWVIFPSMFFLCWAFLKATLFAEQPEERFERFSGAAFPGRCENLEYFFSGGGLADYIDTYYFETTPDEINRLIHELKLKADTEFRISEFPHIPISKLPNSPDWRKWQGLRLLKNNTKSSNWIYYLLTNDQRDRAYVKIGCL